MNPYTVEGSSQLELPLEDIQSIPCMRVRLEGTRAPSSYPVALRTSMYFFKIVNGERKLMEIDETNLERICRVHCD
jgi:hypothetical protein